MLNRTTTIVCVSLGAFFLLGCGLAPPVIIGGDEGEVAVKTAGLGIGNPGDVALNYCSKYGATAVLRTVQKLSQQSVSAVYYYDCRQK